MVVKYPSLLSMESYPICAKNPGRSPETHLSIATSVINILVLVWRDSESHLELCVSVLRIWGIRHQLCIQKIAGLFPDLKSHSSLYFNEAQRCPFISLNNELMILEMEQETRSRVGGSEEAVISSNAGSTVIFWLPDSGQKTKPFTRCHGDAELSAVALDASETRLLSGSTSGTPHKLSVGKERAVDSRRILVLKRLAAVVTCWGRYCTCYKKKDINSARKIPSFGQKHARYKVLAMHWKWGKRPVGTKGARYLSIDFALRIYRTYSFCVVTPGCKVCFKSLNIGALEEIDGMNESDFVLLPEKYFREKTEERCSENLSLPWLLETLKAVFVEKSLFPREIHDHEQKARQLCERACSEGKIKRNKKQAKVEEK
ncbi:LOW QUALITY PROTEIN: cilia- and flagella-associated protein 337 [Alca torda]